MGRRTKVTRQDTADFGLKSESLTSSPLFLPVSRGELGEVSTKEADLRRRGLSHEAALQRRASRRTQGSRALERPLAPPLAAPPSQPRPLEAPPPGSLSAPAPGCAGPSGGSAPVCWLRPRGAPPSGASCAGRSAASGTAPSPLRPCPPRPAASDTVPS